VRAAAGRAGAGLTALARLPFGPGYQRAMAAKAAQLPHTVDHVWLDLGPFHKDMAASRFTLLAYTPDESPHPPKRKVRHLWLVNMNTAPGPYVGILAGTGGLDDRDSGTAVSVCRRTALPPWIHFRAGDLRTLVRVGLRQERLFGAWGTTAVVVYVCREAVRARLARDGALALETVLFRMLRGGWPDYKDRMVTFVPALPNPGVWVDGPRAFGAWVRRRRTPSGLVSATDWAARVGVRVAAGPPITTPHGGVVDGARPWEVFGAALVAARSSPKNQGPVLVVGMQQGLPWLCREVAAKYPRAVVLVLGTKADFQATAWGALGAGDFVITTYEVLTSKWYCGHMARVATRVAGNPRRAQELSVDPWSPAAVALFDCRGSGSDPPGLEPLNSRLMFDPEPARRLLAHRGIPTSGLMFPVVEFGTFGGVLLANADLQGDDIVCMRRLVVLLRALAVPNVWMTVDRSCWDARMRAVANTMALLRPGSLDPAAKKRGGDQGPWYNDFLAGMSVLCCLEDPAVDGARLEPTCTEVSWTEEERLVHLANARGRFNDGQPPSVVQLSPSHHLLSFVDTLAEMKAAVLTFSSDTDPDPDDDQPSMSLRTLITGMDQGAPRLLRVEDGLPEGEGDGGGAGGHGTGEARDGARDGAGDASEGEGEGEAEAEGEDGDADFEFDEADDEDEDEDEEEEEEEDDDDDDDDDEEYQGFAALARGEGEDGGGGRDKQAPAPDPCFRQRVEELMEPLETCVICIDNQSSAILRCGHVTCADCALRWVSAKLKCPLCACKVPPVVVVLRSALRVVEAPMEAPPALIARAWGQVPTAVFWVLQQLQTVAEEGRVLVITDGNTSAGMMLAQLRSHWEEGSTRELHGITNAGLQRNREIMDLWYGTGAGAGAGTGAGAGAGAGAGGGGDAGAMGSYTGAGSADLVVVTCIWILQCGVWLRDADHVLLVSVDPGVVQHTVVKAMRENPRTAFWTFRRKE